MAKRSFSLRTWLIVAMVSVGAIPLLIAGSFGIHEYKKALLEEASRTLETHMNIMNTALAGLGEDRVKQLSEIAGDEKLDIATATGDDLTANLWFHSNILGLTDLMIVDDKGRIVASANNVSPSDPGWSLLAKMGKAEDAYSFTDIVPQPTLEALGLAKKLEIEVEETPDGTIVPGEEDGALSVLTVVPLEATASGQISLVAIDSLKLNNRFLEETLGALEGSASLFQHGVCVSTTMLDEDGRRVTGTVVSDQVREQTLARGEPFRGQTSVVGQRYLTAYDPIFNDSGEVIGMTYAGFPMSHYLSLITSFGVNIVLFAFISFVIAIAFTFLIVKGITKPLNGISAAAAQVAEGELTIEVPHGGYTESVALGESFNAMTDSLRQLIGKITHSADSLKSVSSDIAAASDISADQASRQASAVAQSTATIEELSRTFNAVADGAERVLDTAEDTLESAQSGRETVDNSTATMDNLAAGAEEVRSAAEAAAEVAQNISEMTVIISAIAEQTKILALNAAIEAARAGEAGQGFSVVSTEIRTLADSVARSAKRIKDLVTGVQDTSEQLLRTAERQAELTSQGVDQSRESRNVFDTIVEQVARTTTATREIAAAASEQRTAAQQLVQAMQEVSASSSESAAAAKQLAESARLVENEAKDLLKGMGRFKT